MNDLHNGRCVAELVSVTKEFGLNGSRTYALRNITFRAQKGELVLLLGPSGSGKTTLLTMIAGFLQPTSGSVSLLGKEVEHCSPEILQRIRAERFGFIFQNFLLIDFLTVRENIELVLRFGGRSRRKAAVRVRELLNQLHIGYLEDRYPARLSQGEKQRVAIARALANDPELIIADEPTASLESKQGFEIIQILHGLAKAGGKCVIVASHDIRLQEFANRVVRLQDGNLVRLTR